MSAIAVWWIGLAKTDIIGDQRSLYYLARELLEGELTETERIYLQMYPHQAGMVLLMEAVLLIAGGNYMAFKYVNVLGMVGCVIAGYLLIKELTDRKEDTGKAKIFYLLLMLGCLPLYIYCSFTYNDIIALTFGMAACVAFLRFLKTGGRRAWIGMTVCITIAVILRSNFYILLLAFLCIWCIADLSAKRWKRLAYILPLLLCLLVCKKIPLKVSEMQGNVTLEKGMPFSLWIAMGMQEGDREAGWWNDYSEDTYMAALEQDEVYASEIADETAKNSIRNSIRVFRENPGYALDFYRRKIFSQWNEPSYECYFYTNSREEERSALGDDLYKGNRRLATDKYINGYQSFIFLGAILFMLGGVFQKRRITQYILFVAILGGFLFHILWEAKSRYILPYFILMIPMAAAGLQGFYSGIEILLRKWKKR